MIRADHEEDIAAEEEPRLTIHDIHSSERPREKALRNGFESLTDTELWALVLRSGVSGMNVLDMCRELMRRNDNSLITLSRRSLKELSDIKGMGESKCIQVMAVLEISRRLNKARLPEMPGISSGSDVYELMRHELAHLPQEQIWVLFLDRRLHVKKISRISSGGLTASVVDIKIILKEALLEQAEGLILCHNHPSGNLRPSTQDDNVTARLRTGCEALDIRMLDHVIITSEGFYSYSDNSRL